MTENIAAQIAEHALEKFNEFYDEFLDVPIRAKHAFENRYHRESLRLSNARLQLYSKSINHESALIARLYPAIKKNEARWQAVEDQFLLLTDAIYHADLAQAYLHSIRRKLYVSEWRVEDYNSDSSSEFGEEQQGECYFRIELTAPIQISDIRTILGVEKFDREFDDLERDAHLLLQRIVSNLEKSDKSGVMPNSIEMFRAGFYRNRGAYLVGRFNYPDGRCRPLIIALLNGKKGIYVDAVINSSTYAHNMFSSTLANFHVNNGYYHEICRFLKSIMPMRPLGLHYSTIGYNHLGKVAVMNEIEHEIKSSGEVFSISPGTPGTVAIGFTTPGSAYQWSHCARLPVPP